MGGGWEGGKSGTGGAGGMELVLEGSRVEEEEDGGLLTRGLLERGQVSWLWPGERQREQDSVAVEEGRLQWGRQLKCAKNEAGQVKEGSYEAVEKRVGPGWVQGGEEKVGEQTGTVQRRRGWAGETGEGGDGGLAVAVQ
ncbi:hypothetical protein AAC387_Pa09g0889 [Persea americana]